MFVLIAEEMYKKKGINEKANRDGKKISINSYDGVRT
jgi:hypothetical protein